MRGMCFIYVINILKRFSMSWQNLFKHTHKQLVRAKGIKVFFLLSLSSFVVEVTHRRESTLRGRLIKKILHKFVS